RKRRRRSAKAPSGWRCPGRCGRRRPARAARSGRSRARGPRRRRRWRSRRRASSGDGAGRGATCMTFRLFIYYCALGGGWAAFLAWGLLALLGVASEKGKNLGQVALVGAFLGMLVAAVLSLVDSVLNATGGRLGRVLVSGVVGLAGGALG